jgi:hypothetical protein
VVILFPGFVLCHKGKKLGGSFINWKIDICKNDGAKKYIKETGINVGLEWVTVGRWRDGRW